MTTPGQEQAQDRERLTPQERRELLTQLAGYVLDYDRLADLLAVAAGRLTREDADAAAARRGAEYRALVDRLAGDPCNGQDGASAGDPASSTARAGTERPQ